MARVKRGLAKHRRHKKIRKLAKGYWGARSRWYKLAKEAVTRAGVYAYISRRLRKRDFRRLWILRINAFCRMHDISYSRFMYGLKLAGIGINRKMLAELAVNSPESMKNLINIAKDSLSKETNP
jgi:large subunit ribosomal protein L20